MVRTEADELKEAEIPRDPRRRTRPRLRQALRRGLRDPRRRAAQGSGGDPRHGRGGGRAAATHGSASGPRRPAQRLRRRRADRRRRRQRERQRRTAESNGQRTATANGSSNGHANGNGTTAMANGHRPDGNGNGNGNGVRRAGRPRLAARNLYTQARVHDSRRPPGLLRRRSVFLILLHSGKDAGLSGAFGIGGGGSSDRRRLDGRAQPRPRHRLLRRALRREHDRHPQDPRRSARRCATAQFGRS